MEVPDEFEDAVGNVNFVPCVHFVKRGVAKARPEKINLSPEELARIITESKNGVQDAEEDLDSDASDADEEPTNSRVAATTGGDEFNFGNYDQEEDARLRLGDIAIVDPTENTEDLPDSEDEDDTILKTDNLILVGRVEDNAATLEVYVFNETEQSLYVHHEILLASPPLCIEWLSHDPGSETAGNLCAIGSMDPIITIFDLDIQDCLEPTFKLGKKGSRKKNVQGYGHTDAVLDLSWNPNFEHILASGSVDQTVIIWDLDQGTPATTIKDFNEKVQTLKFHPKEPQYLLTGSCDGLVKLFDCRSTTDESSSFVFWNMNAEIERVAWDHFDNNYFAASSNDGHVAYFDMRNQQAPVWCIKAHEKEITGLVMSSKVKGMLSTTSGEGDLIVWNYLESEPKQLYKKTMKIGQIQCLAECPENPMVLSMGGDNKHKNFAVQDLREEEVEKLFPNYQSAVQNQEDSEDEDMN